MAKRGKTQARRSARNGLSSWAWLLAGLLLGALAFGYLQFRDRWSKPASTLPQPDAQAQAAPPSGDNGLPASAERPKTEYTFYKLLPDREVVIPDAELDAQVRAEAVKPPDASADAPVAGDANAASDATAQATGETLPTTATSNSAPAYLIQAGAFRGSSEAEALKARIALTGEIARVEVAQINGTTVHRVRMGPYANASALAAAKQALASHGISAQAIKVK